MVAYSRLKLSDLYTLSQTKLLVFVKTIPFKAAHTYNGPIWQYPTLPPPPMGDFSNPLATLVNCRLSCLLPVGTQINQCYVSYLICLEARSFLVLFLQMLCTVFSLQVLVSIISGILISFTKLSICTIMRNHGYRALFWCGVSIQTGSFIGAIVMFPLVNILKVFHQAKS